MGLAELLEKGGVYRKIAGNNPHAALTAFIKGLPNPAHFKETLLKAVLEREALMPTGIGNGIALPHPRNPVIADEAGQFAALAFLEKKVNWNSLDGKPVDTLLLVVSASPKQHLKMISEITFFGRQEDFLKLLKTGVPTEELLLFIREAEKNWK